MARPSQPRRVGPHPAKRNWPKSTPRPLFAPCCGVCGVWYVRPSPPDSLPPPDPRPPGRPKFRLFFTLPPQCSFFLPSLGGLLVEFSCLDPHLFTLGSRAAFQTPPKFHEKPHPLQGPHYSGVSLLGPDVVFLDPSDRSGSVGRALLGGATLQAGLTRPGPNIAPPNTGPFQGPAQLRTIRSPIRIPDDSLANPTPNNAN